MSCFITSKNNIRHVLILNHIMFSLFDSQVLHFNQVFLYLYEVALIVNYLSDSYQNRQTDPSKQSIIFYNY